MLGWRTVAGDWDTSEGVPLVLSESDCGYRKLLTVLERFFNTGVTEGE